MRTLFFGFLGLFLFVIYGCGPNPIVENEITFSETGWSDAQPLSTSFTIQDTTAVYDLVLELTHTTDYPHQNVYTKIKTTFPDGKILDKTVSLELASKAGRWFGNCGSSSCSIQIPIQQNAYFNQPGQYSITVEPYMRVDPIEGLEQLAFWVIPSN